MKKDKNDGVFDVAYDKRQEELERLELDKRDVTEELEAAMKDFIKAGGSKKLKAKRRKTPKQLL